MNPQSKRLYAIGAAVVVIFLVAGVAFFSTRSASSEDSAAGSDNESSSTTTASNAPTTTSPPEAPEEDLAPGDPAESTEPVDSGFELPQPEELPLDVSVSNTSGLSDGDTVTVHVTPHAGSSIFGLEAFICKADTTYLLDADIRPSQTGKCISKPLSDNSNDYVRLAVDPPYESADLEFRVGVGSDTYDTQSGEAVTISCGPGNPCQLVLKLQVPDTFGFQAYPLTFG